MQADATVQLDNRPALVFVDGPGEAFRILTRGWAPTAAEAGQLRESWRWTRGLPGAL